MFNLPLVPAVIAMPLNGKDPKGRIFDFQGGVHDQCLGHLVACLSHDPLKGGARYAHLFSRVFLVASFKVGKAHCLKFFHIENRAIQ
jgi:hypothetical protein